MIINPIKDIKFLLLLNTVFRFLKKMRINKDRKLIKPIKPISDKICKYILCGCVEHLNLLYG